MSGNGKIKVGIERFLWKYPLLGGLVATWGIVPDTTIATMAIGLNRDGFLLYFSPVFVERITMDQLVGVLHHEARHAIYGHLFLKPEDYPDHAALTIAEEVTVNEGIPEPLPGKPIRLRKYPQLKKNTDTDTRYRILAKPQPKAQLQDAESNGDPKPDDPSSGGGSAHDDSADADVGGSDEKSSQTNDAGTNGDAKHDDPASEVGAGQGNSSKDQNSDLADTEDTGDLDKKSVLPSESSKKGKGSGTGAPPRAQTVDDHSRWGEITKQEAFAKSVLESTVRQILAKKPQLSDYERQVIEHAKKEWGSTPGQGLSDLSLDARHPPLHWTAILRRYTGQSLCRSHSYSRAPRRFPELLGIVPGAIRRSGKPKVLAVIDTSGSMSDPMLGEISVELTRMGRDYEIVVVECDSMIHRVYRHSGPIRNVLGRGGTDFHPPLEPLFLRKHRPDLIIFFTDGCGPAPETKPKVPVIWVLTEGGENPVAWGQVIKMEPNPVQRD